MRDQPRRGGRQGLGADPGKLDRAPNERRGVEEQQSALR